MVGRELERCWFSMSGLTVLIISVLRDVVQCNPITVTLAWNRFPHLDPFSPRQSFFFLQTHIFHFLWEPKCRQREAGLGKNGDRSVEAVGMARSSILLIIMTVEVGEGLVVLEGSQFKLDQPIS